MVARRRRGARTGEIRVATVRVKALKYVEGKRAPFY